MLALAICAETAILLAGLVGAVGSTRRLSRRAAVYRHARDHAGRGLAYPFRKASRSRRCPTASPGSVAAAIYWAFPMRWF